MKYYGYSGYILFVDLTAGKTWKEPLEEQRCEHFIGGAGINIRLMFDYLKPGVDPLSPDNPLILGVGPLVGTLSPSTSMTQVATKYAIPASRDGKKYYVANAKGASSRFSLMLKNAGYDHVVILGRSPRPCYLLITDDQVTIEDAGDLWGKDIYETMRILKKRHRNSGVWTIGPAAENLVRISHGFVDRSHMGRHMGAVVGSKNLKAVVTYGARGVEIADRKRFLNAIKPLRKRILTQKKVDPPIESDGPAHAPGMVSPYKEGYPQDIAVKTKIGDYACASCVTPDRFIFEIPDGPFAGETLRTTHFLMVPIYGQRLRIVDWRQAAVIMDKINRLGLDVITTIQMVAFVTRLYARGDISTKETDGMELRRDFQCYMDLLDKIAKREGLGAAMADGWYPLREKVGINPWEHWDGTGIVKGTDTIVDPRSLKFDPWQFSQITNIRAGKEEHNNPIVHRYHDTMDEYRVDFKESMDLTDEEIARYFTDDDFNTGRFEKISEDGLAVYESLGQCIQQYILSCGALRITDAAEIYSAVTGLETTAGDLKEKGERIWNLYKVLNVREGFTKEDDAFPPLWIKATEVPVKTHMGESWLTSRGGKRLTKEDLINTLDDYYDERGWDIKTGVPTKEKLTQLGLSEFIPLVEKYL